MAEPIHSEDRGAVRLLTLDRPKLLNALDRATLEALLACTRAVDREPSVRALVVTGRGRAFAAGADVAEMRGHGPIEAEAFSRFGHDALASLEALRVPTIAAVNGYALGGGCELALACDWIYAAETARFGQPEVSLGLIPGFGGTSRLVRRVGVAWAKEMILGGQAIDTSTAERIGLVNRVFPAQDLVAAAVEAGQSVAAGGPLAVALAKRVLQARQDDGAQLARALEQHAFGLVASSHDRAEGMDAFLEKRDPKFTGT